MENYQYPARSTYGQDQHDREEWPQRGGLLGGGVNPLARAELQHGKVPIAVVEVSSEGHRKDRF